MNMKKSFAFLAAALAFFAIVQAQTVVEFDILNPTSFEMKPLSIIRTADKATSVNEVVYTIHDDASTQMIVNIKVDYTEDSGVYDIVIEPAKAQYFNLMGMPCDKDNLKTGVYIRRRGNVDRLLSSN